MGQEIQKRKGETLTFQKQPEQFLTRLGAYLETLQKVYRTKLPVEELALWRDTLKDFSFQEFDAAMKSLVKNPPRYELEDGSVQVWRGMPKLPDVIQVMLEAQEQRAAEYRRQEGERLAAEMRDLERRRRAGEHFYGLADVLKSVKPVEVLKPMPNIRTLWPDIDPDRNRAKLEQQKRDLGIS